MILPLSANLVVRNEAARIAETLRLVRPYVAEIVLVDQSSTDDTVRLSAPLTDVLLHDVNHGSCERSRALAAEHSSLPWILVIDADESLSSSAWDVLPSLMTLSAADVVYFKIATYVGDRFVQEDLMACPRLFRRGFVTFADELHGVIKPLPHATVTTVTDFTAFIHEKSVTEQQADWDRYDDLAQRPRRLWTDESHFS